MNTASTAAAAAAHAPETTAPDRDPAQDFIDFINKLAGHRAAARVEEAEVPMRDGQSKIGALAEETTKRLMDDMEKRQSTNVIMSAQITLPNGAPFVLAVAYGNAAHELHRRCAN